VDSGHKVTDYCFYFQQFDACDRMAKQVHGHERREPLKVTAMDTNQTVRTAMIYFGLSLAAACRIAFAQDAQDQPPPLDPQQQQQQSPAPSGGWRRASDPPPAPPSLSNRPNYAEYPNYSQGQRSDLPPEQPAPPQLVIKSGTFVTVRINQLLSSDLNHPGDAFTASLARPMVVDGVIVAQRGQTVGGRVAAAQKAGRVDGVSHLGVQLTDLTLVDGQQVAVKSQLITRQGDTSVGRDVAAVGTTTAVGAAAGAAAGGGVGAGIGAGAGAVAGLIGVLLTRGLPTIIYPESVLTFRVEAPIAISTERAPYAFRYVDPNDYDRPYDTQGPPPGYHACAGPGCAPPLYYGYGYPWGGVGVYWGPSFFWGRGFYGRGFYGRGFYGGGFRGYHR